MQPEQIAKSIEELWTLTQNPKRPASEIINEYTRARRYIGSKDRKAITEAVWARWRALPYPHWLAAKIPNFDNQLQAMQTKQAPTVLRVNGNRDEVEELLEEQGIEVKKTPLSPLGLILNKRVNLTAMDLFKNGLIEVQDEGSQLIGLATKIGPNDSVLELCAGAGGKSLLFAQMMKNSGQIVASDISARSLTELQKRAKRAKVSIIKTTLTLPDELFDFVVIDVPCSGTGTYRRAPDNVHKITQMQFQKLLKTQAELLRKAINYVKKGGKICYMTCSLTQDENQKQVQNFLQSCPAFVLEKELVLTPAVTDTDGFYFAMLKRMN